MPHPFWLSKHQPWRKGSSGLGGYRQWLRAGVDVGSLGPGQARQCAQCARGLRSMSPFSASTVASVLKHRWLPATCWFMGDHVDTEMDKEGPDPFPVDLTAQQGPWSGAGTRPGVDKVLRGACGHIAWKSGGKITTVE